MQSVGHNLDDSECNNNMFLIIFRNKNTISLVKETNCSFNFELMKV